MSTHEIAFRYSRALFGLAQSNQELEQQLNNLEAIINILSQQPNLMQFFCSPQISLEQKEKIFRDTLEKYFSKQIICFLLVLLEKGRFVNLPMIVKEYRRLVQEKLSILEVELITTLPIDALTEEKFINQLEAVYGKKIEMKKHIDPQLIGGGVLIIANQRIDFSIKGKLARLKADLSLIT